ncbi:MAG: ABC transporter permease [Lachnospiraceae bacterium]|nr:ABC transporter permease [Lachnospiraceae bacterium]
MGKGRGSLAGVVVPVLSIILALLIGCVIIACLGADPVVAMKSLVMGAFGSRPNIGTTLTKATPLIFTSLCACFAYKCGVFNLGGEGQFIMGSIAAVYVTLLTGITGVPAIILALIAGAAAGGLWGFLPGILKITRGQNEMIISIMFNYIATLLMGVVYTNWLRDGSVPQTKAVPKESQLPRIITGMRMTWGFVIAVVLGLCIFYFLQRTSAGFKLRAVGINATAARFNGFPVRKYILLSFIISGAIAGLGGSAELLGTQFRLINGFAKGYGFDGVAMALIGQLNPIATMFVALFFAALRAGATTMQAATGVPTSVSDIIQALVIVFTVAGMALTQLPEFNAFIMKRRMKAGREA